MSLALAQSAFDYVLNYSQQREQFGKPLIDFQAVQIQLAEMKMKLEAARLLLYRAVVNAESGLPSIGESSVAKCFANEAVREVTGKAMQIMGGAGYLSDNPVGRIFRDAKLMEIGAGTSEIRRMLIGRELMGTM